jgi:malonyl-CoA/methylmalonyl-CoA synthetase
MDLPYVEEACVIAVPCHESKELPAAIIRLKSIDIEPDTRQQVNLQQVREDLSSTLPTYKLPALLRIIGDEEEIPCTVAGKPIKRGLLKQLFNISGFIPAGYAEPGVEFWGNQPDQVLSKMKAWDWCGLQRDTS